MLKKIIKGQLDMKKISILLAICLLVLTLGSNVGVSAIEVDEIQTEQLTVKLLDENQNPLSNTYVSLYTLVDGKVVKSGKTNKDGEVVITYEPSLEITDNNIVDIDFAVYAAPKHTELLTYYFTQTYIKDKTKYTEEDIKNYLSNNTDYVELVVKEEHKIKIKKKDERGEKIKKYLVEQNKLSSSKPVHKLTGEDKKDMIKKGIFKEEELNLGADKKSNEGSDFTLLVDSSSNLGSHATTVGEVHSIDGVSATFKYAVDTAVKIDVGTKQGTDANWGISGSLTKRSGWTETWPAFATTSTSGYGKQARTYFQYVMDETISYWSGTITYEVYATIYNGGSDWGSSIYRLDGASVSSIESHSLGPDWAPHQPGGTVDRHYGSSRTFSGAATIPITKLNSSVTLGVQTAYNTATVITYQFATGKHAKYYTYGRGTNWNTIYVSNSSR